MKMQSRRPSALRAGTFALISAAAAATYAIPAPVATSNQWFDWTTDTNPAPTAGYQNSPRLTDANAAAVNSFLQTLGSGAIRAVKVESPISATTANLIFNNSNYHVSYVFSDLETGLNTPVDLSKLVDQVRWVNGVKNGTQTQSSLAFVGGFGFQVGTNDPTMPKNYSQNFGKKHSFAGFGEKDYRDAGANMSNGDLYPGDPSYRNYASGDATSQGAPNIRTGLFVLPAWRVARITDALQPNSNFAGDLNVPFLANFNNYGNPGLDNDRVTPGGMAQFVPGQAMLASGTYPFIPAAKTSNQMLSSRDFATLVSHIRLRGADTYHTLESGVVGISNEQMRNQASAGWTEPHINARMTAADRRLLVGTEQLYGGPSGDNAEIIVDGSMKTIEQAGSLFSGVYSLSQGKLDVLISNMDDTSHKVTLPGNIGGYALSTKDFTLTGGSHLLVEYSLTGSGKGKSWGSYITSVPFTDLDNDRGRPGVPEPTTLSMLGIAAGCVIVRRRRRAVEE